MTPAHRTRLAAAASILWTLAIAAPVWAAATMTLDEPSANDPYFRSTEAGEVVVRGTVTADEDTRIERITFTFTPSLEEGGACASSLVEEKVSVEQAEERSAAFELVIASPCNRSYEVTATVTHKDPLAFGLTRPPEQTTVPVRFAVAEPPAPVKGLKATYEPDGKKVNLTWSPNSEPDIIGYRIERNPPGPDGFKPLPGMVNATTFTDTLDIDEEHRYRVVAIRSGPDARITEIAGEPSSLATAGPDRPEPTVPDTTLLRPPPPAATGRTGSGAKSNARTAAPQARRGPVTTIDDGFGKTLPFDPSQTIIPDAPAVPPEDAAVLAIDDARSDLDDRRATLIPIAGGLALLMAAVHMRLLSKRAAEPELGVYSRPQLR
ncbi:MAG TPA: fibronectin type III domain-containing protein [Acidimicrobiales bacterium]|nr:fibronectin type III domain-containing protein [Acidimicrobiales bacterium]